MKIDVRDKEIVIDDSVITFPASYDDIRSILGEAGIVQANDVSNYYIYDDLGITFKEDSEKYLKYRKAFIDNQHRIVYVIFMIDDAELMDEKEIPNSRFTGNITFFDLEWSTLKKRDGSSRNYFNNDGEWKFTQIEAIIRGNDDEPNYKDGKFTKTLYLSFNPERPKSVENYVISESDEECAGKGRNP